MLPGASWAPSWLPRSKSSCFFCYWAPSWRLLGPSWEDLGCSWRSLGGSWGSLGELLGSSWGNFWASGVARGWFLKVSEQSWSYLVYFSDSMVLLKREHRFSGSGHSIWYLSGTKMELWERLGAQVEHLGATWGHLGPHLGHLRPHVAHLGAHVGHLGASWSHLGAILEPLGTLLGHSWVQK